MRCSELCSHCKHFWLTSKKIYKKFKIFVNNRGFIIIIIITEHQSNIEQSPNIISTCVMIIIIIIGSGTQIIDQCHMISYWRI